MPPRILLADDYADSATSMARLLELVGYEVFTAFDGIAAFNRALVVRPHVALIDLALPRLDGLTLARCFRAQPLLRDTALICLSGRILIDDEERVLSSAFDRLLTKPVIADTLIEVLDSVAHGIPH